ncbi:hypothetical protein HOP50_13g68410 [Chloropicon primus]|nr:hypothetical protein HOP50_13g68410 [Chloropicon primus]
MPSIAFFKMQGGACASKRSLSGSRPRGILESINHWLNQELNEEDSNAAANNNNNNNIMSSPYALVLREALESGLMTEEEYAEAVQEAQRVGSKSPEEKKEIEDYNEAF